MTATTTIQASPEIREFNRALEQADSLCPHQLDPRTLIAWLRLKRYKVTAMELEEALFTLPWTDRVKIAKSERGEA